MALRDEYAHWNRAIIQWATLGVPYNTPVYLSVDQKVLAGLGLGTVKDFCQAVRAQVADGNRLQLSALQNQGSSEPAGVAFLALMVLAANDMMRDDKLDANDFFTHFCQRLEIPGDTRPIGMKAGDEESLWQEWNRWLEEKGWIATAKPGEGSRRYLNYPISQALLREADTQKLCRMFYEKKWTTARSETQLLVDLASEKNLNQHLAELLDDRQRHEVLGAEILAVHQEWLDAGRPEPQRFSRAYQPPTRLTAGLYRTEDRWGDPAYYLYPKLPRHWPVAEVTVENLGRLRLERVGWFYPVGKPLSAGDLAEGRAWPIRGHAHLRELQLPARDFWVLVPDPENPESGALASWGAPKLGSHFTVLFREALWPDLQRLREESLLQWSGERQPAFAETSDWWEIQECQVLAPVWDGLFLQHPELKEALQPRDRLHIALSGGLRVPQGRAWLKDHLPQVTVYGFQPTAAVTLTEVVTGNIYLQGDHRSTNQPWDLPADLPPGTYRIQVRSGTAHQERSLKILNWDDLSLACVVGE
ncbi:hypothetical protein [Synechococcus sp. H55.11]|uniref:hypothetical protein n=1 Tax=unclassified Synechococcus TaxID=2626047 RepID=UPI0039C2D165